VGRKKTRLCVPCFKAGKGTRTLDIQFQDAGLPIGILIILATADPTATCSLMNAHFQMSNAMSQKFAPMMLPSARSPLLLCADTINLPPTSKG